MTSSSMDLTPLQKLAIKLLMANVGSMELSDLQNLAASMIGRMMHESGNAEAVDHLTEFIGAVQAIIAKKGAAA